MKYKFDVHLLIEHLTVKKAEKIALFHRMVTIILYLHQYKWIIKKVDFCFIEKSLDGRTIYARKRQYAVKNM